MTTEIPYGIAAPTAPESVAASPKGPCGSSVSPDGPVAAGAVPIAPAVVATPPTAVAPGTVSAPWSLVAAAAAAARDEVASVLVAGLHAPGALDGLGRVSSTVAWVQDRLETGVAIPDGTTMSDVIDARRSVAEAHSLVLAALALSDAPVARAPRIH